LRWCRRKYNILCYYSRKFSFLRHWKKLQKLWHPLPIMYTNKILKLYKYISWTQTKLPYYLRVCVNYVNITLHTIHCLRYVWYKLYSGSWLCSCLWMNGCHDTNRWLI
jgi:hypothetical protein